MLKVLLGVARLNFLTLALVCIVLAAASAWQLHQQLDWVVLAVVCVLALAAHISVNAFNEYFDFRSGLDYLTVRTPYSGGSGVLPKHPEHAGKALLLALATLFLSIGLGLYLASIQGWELLWIGIPGVLIIYTYTQYLNRFPLLCLLAPGIGFGMLMTLGASWALGGQITVGMWILAIIVSLLANNLLLLNQFPDAEADRKVGRRHYPIVIGLRASSKVFLTMLWASYALLAVALIAGWLPLMAGLGFITLFIAWPLSKQVSTHCENVPVLQKRALGLNVALCHALPLSLALALVL